MRIEILRNLEKYLKGKYFNLKINKNNFIIISNNCWGTFIYKKFGLPYNSPFVNLFIFPEDYIKLLEKFSKDYLCNIEFITKEQSKYKNKLIEYGEGYSNYPIGLLNKEVELHFLHYTSEEDALEKWNRRLEKMNFERLIFKFSDTNQCKDESIKKFDKLDLPNKVCFTAKQFPQLKSVVYLEKFQGQEGVLDEWKFSDKHYDIVKVINNLR